MGASSAPFWMPPANAPCLPLPFVLRLIQMPRRYGKWYVKIMNNMIKKGDEYIPVEFSRLLRIVYDQADSLKEDKLAEFRIRLSVLKVRCMRRGLATGRAQVSHTLSVLCRHLTRS